MAENSLPFSTRLTVAAGAAETFTTIIAESPSADHFPILYYCTIEPDAANVTSIEVGFIESNTGSFQPRCETNSTVGRRPYDGIRQIGPRGGKVAARIVTAAATAVRILVDGSIAFAGRA